MPPIAKPKLPSWADPAMASVTDPLWAQLARRATSLIGADDPTSQVMGMGQVMEVPTLLHGSPTALKAGQYFENVSGMSGWPSLLHAAEKGSPLPELYANKRGTGVGSPNVLAVAPGTRNVMDITKRMTPEDTKALQTYAQGRDRSTQNIINGLLNNPKMRPLERVRGIHDLMMKDPQFFENTGFDALKYNHGLNEGDEAWGLPLRGLKTPWGVPVTKP